MRKLLLLSSALALLGLIGWGAARLALSDQTRVRRRLESMAQGFNQTRLRPIAAGLAPDFTSRAEGVDRAALLDGLRAHFLEHAQGPFPHRVLLPRELLAIELRADEDAADATLVAEFQRRSGEDWEPAWTLEIQATLRRGDDGWQVSRAETVTLEGDPRRLR